MLHLYVSFGAPTLNSMLKMQPDVRNLKTFSYLCGQVRIYTRNKNKNISNKTKTTDRAARAESNLLEQRMLLKRKFSQGMTDNSTLNILPEKEKAFMTKVNEFIDSNISLTELSSSFVADALCVSQSTFNRRVKNLTGMSSAQYLRERRIAYARRLLEETRKSVGEIELACGFDTPGYFSRLFKSVTGMSPSEYRRQHQLE